MKKTKLYLIPFAIIGLVFLIGSSRSDFNVSKNLEILFNIVKSLNIYYVDSVDNDKLIMAAANAMTKTLDPYTEYISKNEMNSFRTMTTGKYGGVGSAIRRPEGSKYSILDGATEGFPIDKSGMSPGDTIMSVDGVALYDVDPGKVSEAMRGTPGTNLTLTVKSIKDGSIKDYDLKRENISISPISYAGVMSDSVGYIGFNNFSKNSGNLFREEFAKLKDSENIKSLILDLRSNGGGLIDESIDLVSAFLPKGTLVTSLNGRNEELHLNYITNLQPIDTLMPIVILIDSNSASASEIVAGTIQDFDRGLIVGNKSVGKGLAQKILDVGYGSALKITMSKYYIPSGRCIQAVNYANENNDGFFANKIPDSLRTKFYTKNGRVVLDGGGIEPDVIVDPSYLNIFTASILARGYVGDYANKYLSKKDNINDVRNFKITDAEFEDFKNEVKNKPIEFRSATLSNMNTMKASAIREGYYDKIKNEINAINAVLEERNTLKSLDENKEAIIDRISLEIISRDKYTRGRIEYAIQDDPYVLKAMKILSSDDYSKMLQPKVQPKTINA